MKVKLTRTDRWYDLTEVPAMWAGRGNIRPDKVHAWQESLFAEPAVKVTGHRIVKATGQPSTSRGEIIFGRYGQPLETAPRWVQDIAAEFPRGENR